MTYAVYAPRVPAHPTRTGAYRGIDGLTLLVFHTSQGGEMPTSAEALAQFISTPRTADNLASYNYIFDTDDVIPIVPDDFVAYAQAGANAIGLSGCFPGLAAQIRSQWFDANTAPMLEQAARWTADKSIEYSIPLRWLSVDEVRAGVPGLCDHNLVRLAFGKTTHTDCGPEFPWDWIIDRATTLMTPTPRTFEEDDDVTKTLLYAEENGPVFCTSGNAITWVIGFETLDALEASGTVNRVLRKVPKSQIQHLIDYCWTGGDVPPGYLQP